MFKNYLKQIGLGNFVKDLEKTKLNNFVAEVFAQNSPQLSEDEIKKLYAYAVPKLSPDGACSILDEQADKPYNLAETYGLLTKRHSGVSETNDRISLSRDAIASLQHDKNTVRLWRLNKLVEKIFDQTKVDWFGIYRKLKNPKGELVLVKEAYKGVFSRAEFPLTKEFAKKSNNSTVGLTGKAIVIQDVGTHTGAYYNCDSKVNSEFCIPILTSTHVIPSEIEKSNSRNYADEIDPSTPLRSAQDNNIIGIIDAEAFPTNHYTPERLLQIAKVAYDLGAKNTR